MSDLQLAGFDERASQKQPLCEHQSRVVEFEYTTDKALTQPCDPSTKAFELQAFNVPSMLCDLLSRTTESCDLCARSLDWCRYFHTG